MIYTLRSLRSNGLKAIVAIAIGFFQAMLVAETAEAIDGPQVTRIFPAGGQSSKSHTCTLVGTFPNWPLQIWTDTPSITVKCLEEKGKVQIDVGNVDPSVRYFRFYDALGASAVVPFIVDRLPDTFESEPNDHHQQAQRIESTPRVVHGLLEKSGDVDTYQVDLVEGSVFVASMDGQRYLRSPMDASIQILNPKGIVLAQNLDHHGLDPELQYNVPKSGSYLVRVFAFPESPDSTIGYAGGEKFVYRLTLTQGPFLRVAYPSVIGISSPESPKRSIHFEGANLATQQIAIEPKELPRDAVNRDLVWLSHPLLSGMINIPINNSEPYIEVEPNERANPMPLTLPCSVTGCLREKKDHDAFRFAAKGGERWRFRVDARSMASSLDGVLVILDATGKELARTDDQGEDRDPKLSWVAPNDGDFVLVIEDLHRQGGEDYFYRIFFERELPDATATVASDLISGKVGQPIEIPITINRQLDFAEEISFSFQELPEGITCVPVVSQGGKDSVKEVKLIITGAMAFTGPIKIQMLAPSFSAARTVQATSTQFDALWLTIVN